MITGLFWLLLSASPYLILLAIIALAGAVISGFTSIGRIASTAMAIVASIVEFFKVDTAAKLVAIAIFFCIGAFIGAFHGKHEERAIWQAKEAEMQRRIAVLSSDNQDLRLLSQQQERDRKPQFEIEVREDDKAFEAHVANGCSGFTDDDLRRLRKYRREPVQRNVR